MKANTQIKFNCSYPMKYGIVVAGTFQNLAGPSYDANYPATSAEVALSLGRPLAGGTRSVTVPLVAPNTLFEDRTTRLDLRQTLSAAPTPSTQAQKAPRS